MMRHRTAGYVDASPRKGIVESLRGIQRRIVDTQDPVIRAARMQAAPQPHLQSTGSTLDRCPSRGLAVGVYPVVDPVELQRWGKLYQDRIAVVLAGCQGEGNRIVIYGEGA